MIIKPNSWHLIGKTKSFVESPHQIPRDELKKPMLDTIIFVENLINLKTLIFKKSVTKEDEKKLKIYYKT